MWIEFVGCSGAGKTTLAARTLAVLRESGMYAASSQDLVARSTRTAWIRNNSVRNLLQNVVFAPSAIRAAVHHHSFLRFATGIITREADFPLDWLSRTRSTLRILASQRVLTAYRSSDLVVLIDEGMLNAAQNLFVHARRAPRLREVRAFASRVSMPDIIVHVRVPLGVALLRTMRRHDPPLRTRSRRDLESFITHGQQVFEVLTQADSWRDRVISVSSVPEEPADVAGAPRQIVESIRERLSTR
jgi:thymidylate kinase